MYCYNLNHKTDLPDLLMESALFVQKIQQVEKEYSDLLIDSRKETDQSLFSLIV